MCNLSFCGKFTIKEMCFIVDIIHENIKYLWLQVPKTILIYLYISSLMLKQEQRGIFFFLLLSLLTGGPFHIAELIQTDKDFYFLAIGLLTFTSLWKDVYISFLTSNNGAGFFISLSPVRLAARARSDGVDLAQSGRPCSRDVTESHQQSAWRQTGCTS